MYKQQFDQVSDAVFWFQTLILSATDILLLVLRVDDQLYYSSV